MFAADWTLTSGGLAGNSFSIGAGQSGGPPRIIPFEETSWGSTRFRVPGLGGAIDFRGS